MASDCDCDTWRFFFFSFIFPVRGKSYNVLESGPDLSWVGLGIHGPNIIAHKAICDYKDYLIVH